MSNHKGFGSQQRDGAEGEAELGNETPVGNRPASNARISTPGAVRSGTWQGGNAASDFLGLNQELSESTPAPLPSSAQHASANAAGGENESWLFQTRDPEPMEASDLEVDEEDPVLAGETSWREETTSKRKLAPVLVKCAAALVVAMLGFGTWKMVAASRDVKPAEVQPLAPEQNSTTGMQGSKPQPIETNSRGGVRKPIVKGTPMSAEPASGAQSAPQATVQVAASEPTEAKTASAPAQEPESRTAVRPGRVVIVSRAPTSSESAEPVSIEQGEQPTVAQVGSSEANIESVSSSIAPPPLGAPLVIDGEIETAPVVVSAAPAPEVESPAPTAEPVAAPVAAPAASIESTLSETTPPADGVHSEPEPSVPAWQSWMSVAVPPGASATAPTSAEGPRTEPSASVTKITPPIQVDTLPPAAGLGAERTSTSTVANAASTAAPEVATASLQPAPVKIPARDPSEIAAEDEARTVAAQKALVNGLKDMWTESDIPFAAIGEKRKLLTPNVGRVKVVIQGNEIFEGGLYAVGEDQIWLNTDYGRLGLSYARVTKMERLSSGQGTPLVGDKGSEGLTGLDNARIRTPGGVFVGKIVSRDADQTVIMTSDGVRITLPTKDVELLTENPRLVIKPKAKPATPPERKPEAPPSSEKKP